MIRVKDAALVYIDETTYSSVSLRRCSWASTEDPVLHQKNNKQMRCTVIGGIGKCLKDGRVMNLAASTNKAEFMKFLVDLK